MTSTTKFYNVTQIMWPKIGNFGICSWFKFNNLELPLGIALKFYTSVAQELKLKVIKIWGLNPTFGKVTGEKLVGIEKAPILNSVNV